MLKDKTPYPDWAAPYTAIWEGGQWVVLFPSELDAKIGLRHIRRGDSDMLFPPLAIAPYPGGGAGWYVGEVHP